MAKAGDADAGKAENGVSQDAPTLSQSDIGQSPILTVIRKRLRAANKRLKRIEEIEGARAAGKSLDADQEESLRSKPKVLANIEELERLQPLLREARNEDKAQIEAAAQEQAQAAAEDATASRMAELEASKLEAEQQAESARAEADAARSEVAELQSSVHSAQSTDAAVHRLVELLYFSTVFADDGNPHKRAERHACVSYDSCDYDGAVMEGTPVTENDLKLISRFGPLVTDRRPGQTLCHKDVIAMCADVAMKFLHKSSEPIPDLDTSAERVASVVDRVLSLDYATVSPEVQPAQQPESTPHSTYQSAPMNHPDAGPVLNDFYEQMHGGQMGGLAFSAPQPPALSYGAPEPHSSHYPPSFQPAPVEYTPQSATQEAPQDKAYYASTSSADLPIHFMTESTIEMEGGHPEPMGATSKETHHASIEPSLHSHPDPQPVQQGDAVSAPQPSSGQAPAPAANGPRHFEGRGGARGRAPPGRGSREPRFEGREPRAEGREGRSEGREGRSEFRDGRGRGAPRGRGPPGPRSSGDLGPRPAGEAYRGGGASGRGGGRRGGPRGGRGGPPVQAQAI